jgi:hypothetical protein
VSSDLATVPNPMDITIHASFLPHDDPEHPWPSIATARRWSLWSSFSCGIGPVKMNGQRRNRHPERSGCRFPDFPFVFKPDNPDQTHNFRRTMTGSSTQGIKTVLHPVSDLPTAKEVYAALLGVPPQTDESYYVGFEAAGKHIGLVPGGGPQGMTSPVAYWHVPDLEAKLAEAAWMPWFLRRARPRTASAGRASRHPGRHRRSGRQRPLPRPR